MCMKLYVKEEFDDVAVFNDIVFPFEANFACFASCCVAACFNEVIISNDFCTDEAAFEVGVNLPCGLWCLGAFGDGPSASFLFTGGEITNQTEELVGSSD